MAREATKLVLGRGEVYFDRFIAGTRTGEGERYLGNTPEFRVQRDIERQDRATSYRGRKIDKPGAVLSESHTLNITCDNIDDENVAVWFAGDVEPAPTVLGERVETFVVKRGRSYQLGKPINGFGVGGVAYVYFSVGGVALNPADNLVLTEATGRFAILPDAVIEDGTALTVRYYVRPNNGRNARSRAVEVHGSLRFVAKNEGAGPFPQNSLYFPFVRLSPRGQIALKSDEWQQWTFEAVAMNLSPSHEQVYVMRQATQFDYLPDEQAIIDEFGSFGPFPFWEDELHEVTNYDWPPALRIERTLQYITLIEELGSTSAFPPIENVFDINLNEEWPNVAGYEGA